MPIFGEGHVQENYAEKLRNLALAAGLRPEDIVRMNLNKKDGEFVERTKDLVTHLGFIVVKCKDRNILSRFSASVADALRKGEIVKYRKSCDPLAGGDYPLPFPM